MQDLGRLLRPRHVAVFGGAWAENVIGQLQNERIGFAGDIWPVHPNKSELCGLPCYRSVSELPAAPDASFIGVNRGLTIPIIKELAGRGAGGAVCFASGFAETEQEEEDGTQLQAQLLQAAGEMPFLGPNCYGFINYLDGVSLWPDQHGGKRVERGVAIISQSSNIAINMTMQARGLPLAYVMTVGNQAQTKQAHIAYDLLDDDRVSAIGLYIEGFGDVEAYQALADKAKELKKPLVALKVGRSAQAKAATVSHTASLAGEDAGASALLARFGIPRVYSISVFLESLKLLHLNGPLTGRRIASMSCSGGEASLIADSAVEYNLSFDALTVDQETALRSALGPKVHLANPLDYQTYIWGDKEAMTATFSAMLRGGFDMTYLVMDFPRQDRCADAAWEPAIESIIDAKLATGSPAAAVTSMAENLSEAWAERLIEYNIIPLIGIDEALAATSVAANIGDYWAAEPAAPLLSVSNHLKNIKSIVLDEAEAKGALAQFAVPVPQIARAMTPLGAAEQAKQLGFPVALKGLGYTHKTEQNAVVLNLQSAADVRQAAERMAASQMAAPDGYLVEEFIPQPVAELIIAILRDPAHGFVLTIGAGGVLTELLQDTQSLLLPVTDKEIESALHKLRIWPLLSGYRNSPSADVQALIATVQALANYAAAHADSLLEVEINPYLVLPSGGYAVDALIRKIEI